MELLSPSNPRYCKALIPLSTTVTAKFKVPKNFRIQSKSKKTQQKTHNHGICFFRNSPLQEEILSKRSMTLRSTWLSSTASTCSSSATTSAKLCLRKSPAEG